MSKYLLLGASSDVCCTFLRRHKWQAEDKIIAQYFHNDAQLIELQKNFPAEIILRQADFSDEESTNNFVNYLKEENFCPTHILHAPAVPVENNRFTEIFWDDAVKQINVQCRSLWQILQAVIPKMSKAKRGNIILVLSSVTLNVPPKFWSSYVMAKYALMGLGKALAAEYAPKNIRVNMLSPSMMETKFIKNIYGAIVEQSATNNPMKRNATPEDVAGLIEYLFSDESSFITGANIPITGGENF